MTIADAVLAESEEPGLRLVKPSAALFDDKANAMWSIAFLAALWAVILAWQAFRQSAFGTALRALLFLTVMALSSALVLWWRFGS